MKKIFIISLIIIVVSVMLTGCRKEDAIWLEDGQTLEIIDNTLGEGEQANLRFTHTYKNSQVTEKKGYVYILPVSETNLTVRYFCSVSQGESGNNAKLVEITNIEDGDKLTPADCLSFTTLWGQGMEFVDTTKKTDTHYSSTVTSTKYCYFVTNNNNMKVWGDKYIDVTVTSSVLSKSPVSFEIKIEDSSVMTFILSHKGDSWEIK